MRITPISSSLIDGAARFAGLIQWIAEKCDACGDCFRACPNRAIVMNTTNDPKTGKRRAIGFKLHLEYCLFCGLCAESCPSGGLYFNRGATFSNCDRKQMIYEVAPAQEDT